jgi:hypothetical protein
MKRQINTRGFFSRCKDNFSGKRIARMHPQQSSVTTQYIFDSIKGKKTGPGAYQTREQVYLSEWRLISRCSFLLTTLKTSVGGFPVVGCIPV